MEHARLRTFHEVRSKSVVFSPRHMHLLACTLRGCSLFDGSVHVLLHAPELKALACNAN